MPGVRTSGWGVRPEETLSQPRDGGPGAGTASGERLSPMHAEDPLHPCDVKRLDVASACDVHHKLRMGGG